MLEEVKKQFTSIQILVTLLIIAAGIYVFQTLWSILSIFSGIFVILIFAWVLSFLLEPLVNNFSKFTNLSKIWSALVVYVLFFALIVAIITLFIPAVAIQIDQFSRVLPKYLSSQPKFLSHFADTTLSSLINSISLIPSVANFIFSSFISLLISFYFVVDKEKINNEFLSLVPKKWKPQAIYTEELIEKIFGSFLRIQLMFGIVGGVFTWILLHFLNVNFAASTSLVSGILMVIPMVGGLFALVPPVLVAFIGDPLKGLIVLLVLVAMQNILFNVLGPRLLGSALKLHPIIILLSFFIGFQVAGIVGAIFATPVLGVLFILFHELSRHFISEQNK